MNKKDCPFCGKNWAEAPDDCICRSDAMQAMMVGKWNERPIENKLNVEIARLKSIISNNGRKA